MNMSSNLEYCLFYDKPVQYKELEIYPVLMTEYIQFHLCVQCLLLDKNSIPDVKTISMTYLEFLYYLVSTTPNLPYLYMLKELLKIVLHINNDEDFYFGDENGKALLKIKGKTYNSTDFDEIVDIIFKQNGIEHIDDSIQKEVRDAMDKAIGYKMQQNAYKMCSLEEQMICVLISTSMKLEDIYNLTIRKFSKILERVDYKLHYQIYKSAEMSGMVSFKDGNPFKHWMADLTKSDKYEEVKVDADEMHNKIDNINK